jgi:hypothetical protein
MVHTLDSSRGTEAGVLEAFSLRWAVLAAWLGDLRSRGGASEPELPRMLEATRLKIASGCISTCEVGCDLARVEAALVSRTATLAPDRVDLWIDTLSEAMTHPEAVKSLPWFRPVGVSYLDCGYRSCACPV